LLLARSVVTRPRARHDAGSFDTNRNTAKLTIPASVVRFVGEHVLIRELCSDQSALGLEFPPDEAEKQLAIAIDWGRYAEVIAYDHSAGMIYLEAAPVAPSQLPEASATR